MRTYERADGQTIVDFRKFAKAPTEFKFFDWPYQSKYESTVIVKASGSRLTTVLKGFYEVQARYDKTMSVCPTSPLSISLCPSISELCACRIFIKVCIKFIFKLCY